MVRSFDHLEKAARDMLVRLYNDNFKFHFTKPVNQILRNEPSHATSVFHDVRLLLDPKKELRRYYTLEESLVRLKNYIEYYGRSYESPRPHLPRLTQKHILFKNKKRKAKYYLREAEDRASERRNLKPRPPVLQKLVDPTQYMSCVDPSQSGFSSDASIHTPFIPLKPNKILNKIVSGSVHDIFDGETSPIRRKPPLANNFVSTKLSFIQPNLNISIATNLSGFDEAPQSEIRHPQPNASLELEDDLLNLRNELRSFISHELAFPLRTFMKK